MKIRVNKVLCVGHGVCAMKAPGVFKLDEDGYLKDEILEVPPNLQKEAVAGASSCPERAITLEE